jgi:sugar transferase (PEP-CTERM/EpsH1 system associated)
VVRDILFLAHRVPFPPDRGDKIRSHHLLAHLAKSARVHVGCFSEDPAERAAIADLAAISASHCVVPRTKPLVLAGAEAVLTGKPVSLTAFHSARLEHWVRKTVRERSIAAIVVFSGQMGQYVPADFAGRVIIDLCDVDSAKFESYAAAGERVWLNAREARLLAAEEARLATRSDATLLISEAEAALLRSRLGHAAGARIEVIGNGIDALCFDPVDTHPHSALATTPGPHFVFTGQMDYRPNEAAALWAIEHFLPAARAHFGEAHFHVVGRAPTPALLRHGDTAGVHIWGEVPDVRPFIAAGTCLLGPLLIARGVQNKVLEAMAMARPVLLTPEAATGIAARDGEHWMVAEADPATMLDRLEGLLAEQGAAERMGKAARDFVIRHHAWDAMLAPLDALVHGGSGYPEREARNAA